MTLADPVMVTRSVAEARAAGRDSIRLKPPAPHTSTPTQRARTPALAQGTPTARRKESVAPTLLSLGLG